MSQVHNSSQAASPVAQTDLPTADVPEGTRRPRTWPAILTLYVLAPILGEVFSTSTPPLVFLLDPSALFWETALYGSGAMLVRELVRRRGLGWSNILLLGAVYGVLEEGIFIQSWFNPFFPTGLGTYGRYWETNWVWALELTVFHAVFSIAIPIVLAEALFPKNAQLPWLGRKGRWSFAILLGLTTSLGVLYYGFVASAKRGYAHPPAATFAALMLMIGLYATGVYARPITPRPTVRATPSLWSVRVAGLAFTFAFFAALYGLAGLHVLPLLTMVAMASVVVWAAWTGYAWAGRAGWGERHRLALASGAFAFWFLFSFLAIASGLPIVSLIFLGLLIWLARRVARQGVTRAA